MAAEPQQHRYNQPPSKVLHIRNLPYEATDEELRELCAPFGVLVQTKLAVGPNKNQAFVEFTNQDAAVQMVGFFASSVEPAKVRGKTVYLQYSTRQEIVNSKAASDGSSGNVLLVSLENLTPEHNITLDTLHLVFSAFGFVHKIATFEKGQGFQALVQYGDSGTAEQVRTSLDGHHIPKHLLSETPNPPLLKIAYSQHQDLNVKFQSHRSRDYTNPYLPTAPAGEDASGALGIQVPLSANPMEGNVLLCAVENQAYPVTVDPLFTVFSPYGTVQKIAIFEKNSTHQALIQFSDAQGASNAKAALEGHAIYDGGYNRLKISYSVHRDLNVKYNNDRGWDYLTYPGGPAAHPQVAAQSQQPPPQYMQPAPHGYQAPRPYGHAPNGAGPGPGFPGAIFPPAPHHDPHQPVVVTGMDYEVAHDTVAKAAQQAAASGIPMGQGPRGPPGYGAPPYGGQPGPYGAPYRPPPPAQYGAPGGYGAPRPAYGAPAAYGAPGPSPYGAPQAYGQPGSGAPQPGAPQYSQAPPAQGYAQYGQMQAPQQQQQQHQQPQQQQQQQQQQPAYGSYAPPQQPQQLQAQPGYAPQGQAQPQAMYQQQPVQYAQQPVQYAQAPPQQGVPQGQTQYSAAPVLSQPMQQPPQQAPYQ